MAILYTLQRISRSDNRKFCVYSDSMSQLQQLNQVDFTSHPIVLDIVDILRNLEIRGFEIVFCWIPSHVGIPGNEKADNAACLGSVPYSDMCQIVQQKVINKWQELWNEQIHNKLHNVKPVIANWPILPYRKADATLTRLRIGHTRYLLFQEPIPMCTS
ncbi:hypothetical protein AVEN_208928-1 [Araneus ventricosus]|uniref:RNase H type-1 domain-containing protein n=1 Tax=Araneus ventricosus TaxID=182803 RepID=A0A4Y2Q5T2_ARAVE|nr:hypothetical protein AVEN_208928-1 [Araneus ventricosus]